MRREKSLRIGVHHANGVVWGPVYRTHLVDADHRQGADERREERAEVLPRGLGARARRERRGGGRRRARGVREQARARRRRRRSTTTTTTRLRFAGSGHRFDDLARRRDAARGAQRRASRHRGGRHRGGRHRGGRGRSEEDVEARDARGRECEGRRFGMTSTKKTRTRRRPDSSSRARTPSRCHLSAPSASRRHFAARALAPPRRAATMASLS